jgi:hypothetical protein
MQFDLTSIQPNDPLKDFLSAVMRIDKASINMHMQNLAEFDIEITVNGRSIMPDVLIKTMLAAKDREIASLREKLTQESVSRLLRSSASTGQVSAPVSAEPEVVQAPATQAQPETPTVNYDADVTVSRDLVVFKKEAFKKFYESTQQGVESLSDLLLQHINHTQRRKGVIPSETLVRLLTVESKFGVVSKMMERVRNDF